MSTTLFKSEGMDPVKYWFDTPVNATTSMSKFWFEVDERDGSQVVVHDNGGTGCQRSRLFFTHVRSCPQLSSLSIPA